MSEATVRKSNGQFLAAKRAGKVWQESTLDALDRFIAEMKDKCKGNLSQVQFTFEEFRIYCEVRGMPAPASLNAWGSLPSIAARKGWCRWSGGVRCAIRAESHGRILKVWDVA